MPLAPIQPKPCWFVWNVFWELRGHRFVYGTAVAAVATRAMCFSGPGLNINLFLQIHNNQNIVHFYIPIVSNFLDLKTIAKHIINI